MTTAFVISVINAEIICNIDLLLEINKLPDLNPETRIYDLKILAI
jgi:hypothetical protein